MVLCLCILMDSKLLTKGCPLRGQLSPAGLRCQRLLLVAVSPLGDKEAKPPAGSLCRPFLSGLPSGAGKPSLVGGRWHGGASCFAKAGSAFRFLPALLQAASRRGFHWSGNVGSLTWCPVD